MVQSACKRQWLDRHPGKALIRTRANWDAELLAKLKAARDAMPDASWAEVAASDEALNDLGKVSAVQSWSACNHAWQAVQFQGLELMFR